MKVFYLQQLWEDVMVGKAQADGGGGGGGVGKWWVMVLGSLRLEFSKG